MDKNFDDAELGRAVRHALIQQMDGGDQGRGVIVTLRDHRRKVALIDVWGEPLGEVRSDFTITGD